MFSLKDFNQSETEKITVDKDTGSYSVSKNTFLGAMWEGIKTSARFKILATIFIPFFMLVAFAMTGDWEKSKTAAGVMAEKGAKDDYWGLGIFMAEESGHRNTKLNIHPFYSTKGVRELERKFEVDFGRRIKFSKVLSYMIYEDQDFMVMKRPAKGKDGKKLDLDNWTILSMSADDYCEDYFDGFLPSKEMETFFLKESIWRVKKIKNKEDKNYFRCIIGPDTIKEYIEDDRQG